jgi:hypothetical protein
VGNKIPQRITETRVFIKEHQKNKAPRTFYLMTKKTFQMLVSALIGTLLYHSVYFEKLSTRPTIGSDNLRFQAAAKQLYEGILKIESPLLSTLESELKINTEKCFQDYGNRLGIGQSAYFFAKIDGEIMAISNENISIKSNQSTIYNLERATVFGNAIRDASKLVALTDYKKTAEFNTLSEALNGMIRDEKLPIELASLKVGNKVSTQVALKISRKNPTIEGAKLIPVRVLPM